MRTVGAANRSVMNDVIAVLAWAVPVILLAYLCWTTTNILRGIHRISEKVDRAAATGVAEQEML